MRKKIWVSLLIFGIVLGFSFSSQATLIVGAPTPNGNVEWYPIYSQPPYYEYVHGVEFTLADTYDISHIDVTFVGADNNDQPFDWSLQNSLTGTPTVYASGSFTAGLGYSPTNETLAVNSVLGSGTYYLLASSAGSLYDNFNGGWMVSNGNLVSNGGTGENADWASHDGGATWVHQDTSDLNCYSVVGQYICLSPVYAVYSSDAASVPEPGTLLLLGSGFILLVPLRKYCLRGDTADWMN